MDFLLTAGQIFLFTLAVANIALTLKSERSNLSFVRQVWMRFRFGMFIQCLLIFVLIIAVALLLIACVPVLKYGWLHLFLPNGGNALMYPVTDASSSDNLLLRLIPYVFGLAFLIAIPFMAKIEEKMFRKGHTRWPDIWWQSTKFGLVHCLVGIPVGVGIALILGGLFYAYHYKRAFEKSIKTLSHEMAEEEALMVSTTYHSMYNTIVITIVLVNITFIA